MKSFLMGLVSSITGEVTDNLKADAITLGFEKLGAEGQTGDRPRHRTHTKFNEFGKGRTVNLVPEEFEQIKNQLKKLEHLNLDKCTCNIHDNADLKYICILKDCQMPLCDSCLEEHQKLHQQQNTSPQIVNLQERREILKKELKEQLFHVEKLKDYTRDYFKIMDLQDYQVQLQELQNMLLRFIKQYFENLKEKTIKVYEEIQLKNIKQNVLENQFFVAADWSQRLDDLEDDNDFLRQIVTYRSDKLQKQMNNLKKQVEDFNVFYEENQPIFHLRNDQIPKQQFFKEVFQNFIEFKGEQVFQQKRSQKWGEAISKGLLKSHNSNSNNKDQVFRMSKLIDTLGGNVNNLSTPLSQVQQNISSPSNSQKNNNNNYLQNKEILNNKDSILENNNQYQQSFTQKTSFQQKNKNQSLHNTNSQFYNPQKQIYDFKQFSSINNNNYIESPQNNSQKIQKLKQQNNFIENNNNNESFESDIQGNSYFNTEKQNKNGYIKDNKKYQQNPQNTNNNQFYQNQQNNDRLSQYSKFDTNISDQSQNQQFKLNQQIQNNFNQNQQKQSNFIKKIPKIQLKPKSNNISQQTSLNQSRIVQQSNLQQQHRKQNSISSLNIKKLEVNQVNNQDFPQPSSRGHYQ